MTPCSKCVEQMDAPGVLASCAKVAEAHGLDPRDVMIVYLKTYHAKGHVDDR